MCADCGERSIAHVRAQDFLAHCEDGFRGKEDLALVPALAAEHENEGGVYSRSMPRRRIDATPSRRLATQTGGAEGGLPRDMDRYAPGCRLEPLSKYQTFANERCSRAGGAGKREDACCATVRVIDLAFPRAVCLQDGRGRRRAIHRALRALPPHAPL